MNHSVPNVFGKSTVIGHLTFVSEEVRKEDFGGRGVADVFSLVIESFFRMESLRVWALVGWILMGSGSPA